MKELNYLGLNWAGCLPGISIHLTVHIPVRGKSCYPWFRDEEPETQGGDVSAPAQGWGMREPALSLPDSFNWRQQPIS